MNSMESEARPQPLTDMTTDYECSWLIWGGRDCWPFARIIIVCGVLAAGAHQFGGWTMDARRILSLPGHVLGVLSVLAMLSFALAELYLLLFAIPLYFVGVLNDWFYDFSRWLCRVVFRMSAGPLLAVAGVCGEILLFGWLGVVIWKLHP